MRKLTLIVLPLMLVLGSCGDGGNQPEAAAESAATTIEATTTSSADVPATTVANTMKTRLVSTSTVQRA